MRVITWLGNYEEWIEKELNENIMAQVNVLYLDLPKETRENHGNFNSDYPVARWRFEPGTSCVYA